MSLIYYLMVNTRLIWENVPLFLCQHTMIFLNTQQFSCVDTVSLYYFGMTDTMWVLSVSTQQNFPEYTRIFLCWHSVSKLRVDGGHKISMSTTMIIVNELSMKSHDGRLKWSTQFLLSSMENNLYICLRLQFWLPDCLSGITCYQL